jgi:transcriptional antiterminator NusG
MNFDDEIWYLVRNIPKVSSLLGSRGKPAPISQAEVDRILKRAEEDSVTKRHKISYEVGESVRVLDGPFTGFYGTVEEADNEKERMKVLVTIFGRPTPVDLDYTQVERY